MDIALYKTYKSPTWKEYSLYAHLFVHSDFIQSHCTSMSSKMIDGIRKKFPRTYLIHGAKNSAGEAHARDLARLRHIKGGLQN